MASNNTGSVGMSPELEQIMRRQRQRSSGHGGSHDNAPDGTDGSSTRPPTGAPPASPGRSAAAHRRNPVRSSDADPSGGDAHRIRRRSRSRSASRGRRPPSDRPPSVDTSSLTAAAGGSGGGGDFDREMDAFYTPTASTPRGTPTYYRSASPTARDGGAPVRMSHIVSGNLPPAPTPGASSARSSSGINAGFADASGEDRSSASPSSPLDTVDADGDGAAMGPAHQTQHSTELDALEQAVSGYTSSHDGSRNGDRLGIDDDDVDEENDEGEEDLPMDEREDSVRSSPSKSPRSRSSPSSAKTQSPTKHQPAQSGEASGWAWNTGTSASTSTKSMESWQNLGFGANAEAAAPVSATAAVATAGPDGDPAPDWFSPVGSTAAGFFASNDFFGESKFADANDQALSEEQNGHVDDYDDDDDDGFGARATQPRPSTPPIPKEVLDSNPDIAALRESKPVIDFQPRLLRYTGPPTSSLDGGEEGAPTPTLPPPVVNPLSGNLIALHCKSSGSLELQEMDLTTTNCRSVLSAPILTVDMRRRVHAQYGKSPISVAGVTSIAAGVHRQQGRARVRVAAIVDFVCVEAIKLGTNKPTADLSDSILRVVAVWSWGYATFSGRPVALQSVISPPSSSQGRYDDTTLCVADGLLFLSATESPPTVFVAKPTVRDGWTDCRVGLAGSDASISALAVTTHPSRGNKYLAVGQVDGSTSVWSYDLAATTNKIAASSTTASGPRLLTPVCRLDGAAALKDTDKATLLIGKRFGSRDQGSKPADISIACTSLEWLPPGPEASTPLLLAAAFPDGVAVFHVSIPLVMDLKQLPSDSVSELSTASLDDAPSSTKGGGGRGGGGTPSLKKSGPTTNSTLEQAVLIAPIAAARTNFDHRIQRATVSWLNLGPRAIPAVSLLFEHLTSSDKRETLLVVGSIDLTPFGRSKSDEDRGSPRPIVVLCERNASIQVDCQTHSASGIIGLSAIGSVLGNGDGAIFSFSPYLSRHRKTKNKSVGYTDDRYFVSLFHPISSEGSGLNSGGFISTETEDVLHVFSVYQRKRESLRELSMSAGGRLSDTLGMTEPVIRHWLCRSVVGDKKSTKKAQKKSSSVVDGFSSGGDEVTTSGADTSVVLELTCASEDGTNLNPTRIIRSPGGTRAAILFSTGLSTNGRVSVGSNGRGLEVTSHPGAYAMVDLDSNSQRMTSFELRRGIDVAFLSDVRALILCEDQRSIQELTYSDDGVWSSGEALPLPFAASDNIDAMVPRRVFVNDSSGAPRLLFSASRVADGRSCLFLCDGLEGDEMNSDTSLAKLILLSDNTKRFWFDRQEHLLSLVALPNHQEEQKPCIAVATQSRVVILSCSLRLMARFATKMPASSLIPLGSHCVAFCSSSSANGGGDAKIRYLSCIKDATRSQGIIATIPRTKFGYASHLLLAIRPDRSVYLSCHSGSRMVEHGENMNRFLAPIPTTRPAFLLEPLIASALSQSGGVGTDISENDTIQILLRTLLERFGRKTSSFPHSENEGTGTLGEFGSICATHTYLYNIYTSVP